jgi:hypothetical protein
LVIVGAATGFNKMVTVAYSFYSSNIAFMTILEAMIREIIAD